MGWEEDYAQRIRDAIERNIRAARLAQQSVEASNANLPKGALPNTIESLYGTGPMNSDQIIAAAQNGPVANGLTDQARQQISEQQQIAAQLKQEQDLREKTRQDILARIPGLQTELGNSLLNQEQHALSVERPLIDASLNARGLLNSGALAEAYARAQKDLESQRQARLSDFAIGAKANAELGMPQEAANQAIDLQRAGLQRGFGLSDSYREQAFQNNLNSEALRQAAGERQRRRRAALGAGVGAGLGAGLGGYLGGPYGAEIGYGIGSGIGGSFGI